MTRLILLDRDGVINVDSANYITSVDEWRPLPGALEAIVRLHKAGHRIGVCTNQSGIGRGLLSEQTLADIHQELTRSLRTRGADLDGLCYCPHLPEEGCACRKPQPAMLLTLMSCTGIPADRTCFVGDSLKDVQAAHNAGVKAVLVRTGNGTAAEAEARGLGPVAVFDDLAAFADSLLASDETAAPKLQH